MPLPVSSGGGSRGPERGARWTHSPGSVFAPCPYCARGWGVQGWQLTFGKMHRRVRGGGAVGSRVSGAFALVWGSASQCLGPLGLLEEADVAFLLLAPPVALGSGAGCGDSLPTGSWYSTSIGGGGGLSSSAVLGPTETCPRSSGEHRRPSSAKESAFSLPRIPIWDGSCSH